MCNNFGLQTPCMSASAYSCWSLMAFMEHAHSKVLSLSLSLSHSLSHSLSLSLSLSLFLSLSLKWLTDVHRTYFNSKSNHCTLQLFSGQHGCSGLCNAHVCRTQHANHSSRKLSISNTDMFCSTYSFFSGACFEIDIRCNTTDLPTTF